MPNTCSVFTMNARNRLICFMYLILTINGGGVPWYAWKDVPMFVTHQWWSWDTGSHSLLNNAFFDL